MPTLFLKCRSCAKPFPSGIAVTEETALHAVQMNGMRHKCPNCGETGTYFTHDYFVPDGIEITTEDPPDSTTAAGAAQKEEMLKLSGYGVGTG